MLWVGGMLFITLVVAPFLKTIEDEKKRSEIYQVVGKRFRSLGWVAIIVLLVTGPVNLYYMGITPSSLFSPSFYSTSYGMAIGLKISFVFLIVVTSLLHDFWLGPRARTERRYSRLALIFGRGNLIIALIIVILAIFVRAGGI